MRPRICVPVMEKTVERAVRSIRLLERYDPDFVEIRFDQMKTSNSVSRLRDATERRLIATNRSRAEGGRFLGTEDDRLKILTQAAHEGFDYVDIELHTKNVRTVIRDLKQCGARTIVSYHNERFTPAEAKLESILASEKRVGAYICKIVGTARRHNDGLRCLRFVDKHARNTRLVCFCKGTLGIPSRVLSPILGAYFTFASSSAGRETASGQVPIHELQTLYKELGVS